MLAHHQKISAVTVTLIFIIGLSRIYATETPPRNAATEQRNCKGCHSGIETIGTAHDFECIACHFASPSLPAGSTFRHDMLIRNPSDPKHVTHFCGKCHPKEIQRLATSLHGTNAGLINQTRFLWGAQSSPKPLYSANQGLTPLPASPVYPRSPAQLVDDFLRRKCLRCHISVKGGMSSGLYRATGCAACHMIYRNDGLYRGNDAAIDKSKPGYPSYHRFTKQIPNTQCLHCHHGHHTGWDYHGFFERDYHPDFDFNAYSEKRHDACYGVRYHQLKKDIHAEKGLLCIDCHQGAAVMGDGTVYANRIVAPKPGCDTCHGGFNTSLKPKDTLPQFVSRNGRTFAVPRFSNTHPGHNPQYHRRVACSACHAQWSYQDYGFSVIRIDSGRLKKWTSLTCQGDPTLEKKIRGYIGQPNPTVFTSTDYLDGNEKAGLWLAGYHLRRWEAMPLGVDRHDRISIIRPCYQYHISYVDRWGDVVLDSVIPAIGNKKSKGWAVLPVNPHTLSATGRFCYACHLNETAAGKGLLSEATPVLELTRPSNSLFLNARLLSDTERKKLLQPSERFRAELFIQEYFTRRTLYHGKISGQ